MADTEIPDLASINGADLAAGDLFVVIDVSDTSMDGSGTAKKITRDELLAGATHNKVLLAEQSTPSTPASGLGAHFFDSADSEPKAINDGGLVYGLGALRPITFVIDGGAVPPTVQSYPKAVVRCPFDGTIVRWSIFGDVSGSAVVDIWKDTYANFPPTNADSITGTDKPTLSSAQKAESTALTGWTTTVTAGDVLYPEIESASTLTFVVVQLWIRPT